MPCRRAQPSSTAGGTTPLGSRERRESLRRMARTLRAGRVREGRGALLPSHVAPASSSLVAGCACAGRRSMARRARSCTDCALQLWPRCHCVRDPDRDRRRIPRSTSCAATKGTSTIVGRETALTCVWLPDTGHSGPDSGAGPTSSSGGSSTCWCGCRVVCGTGGGVSRADRSAPR